MILSNAAGEGEKPVKTLESITTLGNTLTEKGFLWAGQFCYLMADQSFGNFNDKSSKIVLIGEYFFKKTFLNAYFFQNFYSH